MIEGIKTNYYTDVKLPVKAGMPLGGGSYKIKVVGYETYRQYFDSPAKDWQVGRERIKRVINA
jgi:hypothetical protein